MARVQGKSPKKAGQAAKSGGAKKPAAPASAGGNRIFILGLAALAVLGVAAIAVLASGRDPEERTVVAANQTAPVEVSGEPLAPLPNDVRIGTSDNDPLNGAVAPTLVATGFDGEEVTIGADGSPKAIYFLAHWCPHCQEELPMLQGLIADGRKPDNLEIYGVSTAVDQGRGNFPPQDWFDDEGFTGTVLRDDDATTAIANFGGAGFPYAVYLDGQNRVVARTSGNTDADTTVQLWETTASAG